MFYWEVTLDCLTTKSLDLRPIDQTITRTRRTFLVAMDENDFHQTAGFAEKRAKETHTDGRLIAMELISMQRVLLPREIRVERVETPSLCW